MTMGRRQVRTAARSWPWRCQPGRAVRSRRRNSGLTAGGSSFIKLESRAFGRTNLAGKMQVPAIARQMLVAVALVVGLAGGRALAVEAAAAVAAPDSLPASADEARPAPPLMIDARII